MITIENISKSYGEKKVLLDISYIFKQKITCIIGPSGCGKTTLANIIAGLIEPDSGTIKNPNTISYVFQEDRLLGWESPITNILLVTKDKIKAQTLLKQAKLEDVAQKKTKTLSGGMQRRVAICRGLAANYQTLILDEPFKGLDKDTKLILMDMVKEETNGKTVLLITHDNAEIEYMKGEILQLG